MNSSLKNELNKYDFKFSKNFGQNFISDTNLLNAICDDAEINKQIEVLEIGTGAGTLTKVISEKAKKVVSYEIDKTLIPVLQDKFQNSNNIELVFKDIMKEDNISLKEKFSGSFKIVANIPYYITTPIIFKFIESGLDIESITIMIQQEVAQRLVASEGTKEYGAITVVLNTLADVKLTRIVNRKMFTPAPQVDSAIVNIKFVKNKYDIKDKKIFSKFVRSAFASRRKTLVNNICSAFALDKQKVIELLKTVGLDANIRGESLTIEKMVEISNLLK